MGHVAVLGAGSWGTALAEQLARAGNQVRLWDRNSDLAGRIQDSRQNSAYFPGATIHSSIFATSDLSIALSGAEMAVVAVPSSAVRDVLAQLKLSLNSFPNPAPLIVIAAKGIERGTLLLMHSVALEVLGAEREVALLSGPSFALEVLQDLPTAVTIAAASLSSANRAASFFHSGNFRVYTSQDLVGVEIGGATKNVIAIAVGAVDGVNIGLNARAALITRGLAEISRLALAMGGQPRTIMGLSGLGDLLLTATGNLSRNRRVGLGLAEGKKLEEILAGLGQVAEGVENAEQIVALAGIYSVNMPITEEVLCLLRGEHSVKESVARLLSRDPKSEF